MSDGGKDTGVKKDSLETVIEQVRLETALREKEESVAECLRQTVPNRGGRIRVAECLRQTVPNRWASLRKRSFTKCFCVYTKGDKDSAVGWV